MKDENKNAVELGEDYDPMDDDDYPRRRDEFKISDGLYVMTVSISRLPHWGRLFKEVNLHLFRESSPPFDPRAFVPGDLDQYKDTDPKHLLGLISALFTLDEAYNIGRMLLDNTVSSISGLHIYPARQYPDDTYPFCMLGAGGSEGTLVWSRLRGFDPSFELGAYYKVRQHMEVDAEVIAKEYAVDPDPARVSKVLSLISTGAVPDDAHPWYFHPEGGILADDSGHPSKRIYTIEEFAELIEVSPAKAYEGVLEGIIPAEKQDGKWIVAY